MKAKTQIRRNVVLALLAFTRFFERADYHVPIKWYSLLDSLRVSSGVLHERIGFIDPETEQEFRQIEKRIDIQLGNEKPYSEEELEKIHREAERIEV